MPEEGGHQKQKRRNNCPSSRLKWLGARDSPTHGNQLRQGRGCIYGSNQIVRASDASELGDQRTSRSGARGSLNKGHGTTFDKKVEETAFWKDADVRDHVGRTCHEGIASHCQHPAPVVFCTIIADTCGPRRVATRAGWTIPEMGAMATPG